MNCVSADAAKPQSDYSDDVVVDPVPILEFTLQPTTSAREETTPWNEGGRYFLHCQGNTSDNSPVGVYWFKDDLLINNNTNNNDDIQLSKYMNEKGTLKLDSDSLREKFRVFRNGTLRIDNVDLDVVGSYQCVITNTRGGLLLSNQRNVSVYGKSKQWKYFC